MAVTMLRKLLLALAAVASLALPARAADMVAETTALNRLYKDSAITLSNNDLTATTSSGTGQQGRWARSTLGATSGNKCFKTTIVSGAGSGAIGLGFVNTTQVYGTATGHAVGETTNGVARYDTGAKKYNNASGSFTLSFSNGDAVLTCIKLSNGHVWWKVNSGNWNGSASGDPVNDVDGETSQAFTSLHAAVELQGVGEVTVDFNPSGMPSGYTGFVTSPASESATVASGLTKSDWIVNSSGNNNIEYSTFLSSGAFTTNGTSSVTVNHTGHGKSDGAQFSIEDGPTINGLDMNGAWTIASHTTNSYTFTHTGTANGSSTSGSAVVTFGTSNLDGKMRFQCFYSHASYDDPVKFPGIRGATHLHNFLGNTLTDHNSTYASLRATGNGTCNGGPMNRSAYWHPAMLVNSGAQMLWPDSMTWYYVVDQRANVGEGVASNWCAFQTSSGICTAATGGVGRYQCSSSGNPLACPELPVRRLPRGLQAIFGFDPGFNGGVGGYPAPQTGEGMFHWTCQDTNGNQQGGAYGLIHDPDTPSNGLTSNASCPSAGIIQVRGSSPNCWNGQLDSSDHFSHFAGRAQDGFGHPACPATHPYAFLSFEILVRWSYSGGFAQVSNWWLSSDRHNGATHKAGKTWHWDMVFAWEDDVMEWWSTNTLGMYPNNVTTKVTSATRIYSQFLGGVGSVANNVIGGKHLRNFNDGGLGVGNITPCTAAPLSMAFANCALLDYRSLPYSTISGGVIDTPSPAGPGKVHFRRVKR